MKTQHTRADEVLLDLLRAMSPEGVDPVGTDGLMAGYPDEVGRGFAPMLPSVANECVTWARDGMPTGLQWGAAKEWQRWRQAILERLNESPTGRAD